MYSQMAVIQGVLKGNLEIARELIYRTAQFIERLPYTKELIYPFGRISFTYILNEKNIEESLKLLQILEEKAKGHHDLSALGTSLDFSGYFLSMRGDWHEAVSRLGKALELFKKTGDTWWQCNSLSEMMGIFL